MIQYFRNIYESIFTVLIGMGVTLKHLFRPAVTLQYPRERKELPARSRMKLDVNIDDCIGCMQCERACPVSCITIETIKAEADEDLGETSNGKKKRMYLPRFDIDMAKCCYCGDCVPPCPTECIYMTNVYEYTEYKREDLVYNFATLTSEEVKEKEANFEKFQAEKEAEKAAAAKAKAEAAAKAKAEKEAAEKNKSEETPKTDNEQKETE